MLGTGAIGATMGAADLVPGFSGGTVALLAGIFPRLIGNVRQGARALSLLVRGRLGDGGRAIAAIEWRFVLPLGVGLLSAVVLLAGIIEWLLTEQPLLTAATLLGLVLGAVVVAWGELRSPAPVHALIALPVAAVTFALLGLRTGAVEDPALLVFLGAGAIAITAMILPGTSGSVMLLLLGMYEHVLGAVNDRDLVTIGVFMVGCVLGLAGASTGLNWLLRRAHDLVLAVLIGLMAGSVRLLWPWPVAEGVGDPTLGPPVAAEVAPVTLAVVAGFVAVIGVATVARRITRSRRAEERDLSR